jgi:hypothetical protein
LRAGFVTLLTLMLVFVSFQYLSKVAKPGDSGQQTRSAFLRWRAMIREVFEGTNVYTGLNEYPNPPIMAIILRPFAELPPVLGAMAWFYTKVGLAIMAALWIFRLVQPARTVNEGEDQVERAYRSDLAKALAILFALPALLGDLSHNNVNIFILFLLAACWELYRRRRDTASGLLLALAIACKVTPLLFLAYFGWKRAWRLVAASLVGLVLWLAIVPGLTFGWGQNTQLLTDWYKLMIERPILKGEVTSEHANQALSGFVYRLLTHSPSSIDYVELGPDIKIPHAAAYHNLVDLGRPAAWWIVKAFTLIFALLIVFFCRTPREERKGLRFAAECGLMVLGMLLLSERTWKHHAVTLLLPAAVLTQIVAMDGSRRFRTSSALMLAVAWSLMVLPGLLGSRVGDVGLVYGSHTLAFLLLTVSICRSLHHDRHLATSVT